MQIAVLALQGAFIEHEQMLYKLGVSSFEIRQRSDLERSYDGLIIPGGESTVQGKLLKHLDMLKILQEKIKNGLPVMATCAGLILLAEKIDNEFLIDYIVMIIFGIIFIIINNLVTKKKRVY